VDRHAAAQPLVDAMSLAQALNLAGAALTVAGGPEQQSEENADGGDVSASDALDGPGAGKQLGQIEPVDELPDDSCGMIEFETLIERLAAHLGLESFGPIDAWGGAARWIEARLGRRVVRR